VFADDTDDEIIDALSASSTWQSQRHPHN